MKIITTCLIIVMSFISCVKHKGLNSELPYQDNSLLDSARKSGYYFYKGKDTVWAGNHGPHGEFKLRFNSIAFQNLSDSGRIPKLKRFPEGSFIVKDVWRNGNVVLYAYMYKRNNKWLWGEAEPGGKFLFRIKDGETSCLGCHTQAGNRDNVVAFAFY